MTITLDGTAEAEAASPMTPPPPATTRLRGMLAADGACDRRDPVETLREIEPMVARRATAAGRRLGWPHDAASQLRAKPAGPQGGQEGVCLALASGAARAHEVAWAGRVELAGPVCRPGVQCAGSCNCNVKRHEPLRAWCTSGARVALERLEGLVALRPDSTSCQTACVDFAGRAAAGAARSHPIATLSDLSESRTAQAPSKTSGGRP